MKITKVTETSFVLDNYFVDTIAIKSFARNNITDPHDQAHIIGLMVNIMALLTKTYKNKAIPDERIECIYRILDRLKKHGYDWQCFLDN